MHCVRILPHANLSFESTYEELKPGRASTTGTGTVCFESTYEELKHLPMLLKNNVLPGFESTYEELKPRIEDEEKIKLQG